MSIRYSVLTTGEFSKTRGRQASLDGSYIDTSDLYKSLLTIAGFHPHLLDVALLCHPMGIRKDQEVSQQCASSTPPPIDVPPLINSQDVPLLGKCHPH